MSKKEEFYQLIEKQNMGEKEKEWTKIRSNLIWEEKVVVPPKRKLAVRWVAVAVSSISLLIGGGVLIRYFTLPQDTTRYCTTADYFSQDTEMTLKDYSVSKGESLLYYNWYDCLEELQDTQLILNKTSEVVCHKEKLFNGETGQLVTISVVSPKVILEEYNRFLESCLDKFVIQDAEINILFNKYISWAWFIYNEYTYFIEMEYVENKESMELLLEELFTA